MMEEIDRIIEEYRRRDAQIPEEFYALDRPANRFIYSGYTKAARELLSAYALPPVADQRILEVGCGAYARWLLQFHAWGVPLSNLCAIDLYPQHVRRASNVLPGADVRVGDAEFLPWPDASFDTVVQSTMFTSILSAPMRRNVAAEMERVLKPGGVILWYDFVYDNPRNPSVKGIPIDEVRKLFPRFTMRYRRVTLAPPLARAVVPVSARLASWLELIPLLRTHVAATLQKPEHA